MILPSNNERHTNGVGREPCEPQGAPPPGGPRKASLERLYHMSEKLKNGQKLARKTGKGLSKAIKHGTLKEMRECVKNPHTETLKKKSIFQYIKLFMQVFQSLCKQTQSAFTSFPQCNRASKDSSLDSAWGQTLLTM